MEEDYQGMVFRSCLQVFGYQDVEADGVLIDGFVMYCADASPYLVLWNIFGYLRHA